MPHTMLTIAACILWLLINAISQRQTVDGSNANNLNPVHDAAGIEIDKEAGLPPLATVTLTSREYIHSPGYVDEVVAQVDVPLGTTGNDRPAWVIQDANYNVVALGDQPANI